MNTICNWILNGKGRGKRYLLLLSVIFSAIAVSIIYFSWNNFIETPQMRKIIMSVPNLKLQNGILTEPVDFYKKIDWEMIDGINQNLTDYHFIIDTQNDDVDIQNLPRNGLYLTKTNAYVTNNGELTNQSLKNLPNFEIKEGQLNEILHKGNIRFSLILFFMLSLILFISLYIWSLVYAVLSYILTLFIPTGKHPFSVRRRLSVASLICGYIMILPLSFWGFYTSVFVFFLTVLLIMSLFLSFLPKMLIVDIDK